jgi:hypothetical protein
VSIHQIVIGDHPGVPAGHLQGGVDEHPLKVQRAHPCPERLGVKWQVQVGAHVSAQVGRDSAGKLLKFSEPSAFAGKSPKFSIIMEQIHQKEVALKGVLRRPFGGVRAP